MNIFIEILEKKMWEKPFFFPNQTKNGSVSGELRLTFLDIDENFKN